MNMLLAATLLAALQQSPFVEKYCAECHDAENAKGGLNLAARPLEPNDPRSFAAWVKVYDRVRDREMPPDKKLQPSAAEREAFLASVAGPLVAADRRREDAEGRSVRRRLRWC